MILTILHVLDATKYLNRLIHFFNIRRPNMILTILDVVVVARPLNYPIHFFNMKGMPMALVNAEKGN